MMNILDRFRKKPAQSDLAMMQPDYKHFAAKDLSLFFPWWHTKITLPAKVVIKRRRGKFRLPYHIVTYDFGQDPEGEYMDICATARNGASTRRHRIYATGEIMYLPPSPNAGVCEYCGEPLPVGQSLCGECGAQIMAHGSIREQECQTLETGFLDLAEMPERERRLLQFVQWIVRGELKRQMRAINAEVSADQLRMWVYMSGPFIGEDRKDFTDGMQYWLNLASSLLGSDSGQNGSPADSFAQFYNERNRRMTELLARFGLGRSEIPHQTHIVFTSFDEPELTLGPGRRIYARKEV
jgi:hypothetical protein